MEVEVEVEDDDGEGEGSDAPIEPAGAAAANDVGAVSSFITAAIVVV